MFSRSASKITDWKIEPLEGTVISIEAPSQFVFLRTAALWNTLRRAMFTPPFVLTSQEKNALTVALRAEELFLLQQHVLHRVTTLLVRDSVLCPPHR